MSLTAKKLTLVIIRRIALTIVLVIGSIALLTGGISLLASIDAKLNPDPFDNLNCEAHTGVEYKLCEGLKNPEERRALCEMIGWSVSYSPSGHRLREMCTFRPSTIRRLGDALRDGRIW